MYRPLTLLGRCAALGLLVLVGACGEDQKPPDASKQAPPIELGIIVAKPETLPVTNNLPGRVAPTRIAEVRARVPGIVVQRVFQQGSMVKEGDVLYRIDPAPFQVRVESAAATLKRAEASQLQAQQQADRIAELRARNVASVQQSENATAALAQAGADVAAARAGLASSQLDLQYSEVKAPISGRIGRALITEGALVGSTAADNLATIQQLDPVYADFTQSAGELLALRRALKLGDLTGADPETANAQLLFDDGSAYKHAGRLLFSEATVDATTGQVTLRGEFPNPDGDLLPGMYVRVVIEQGVQASAVTVPQQAVQRNGNGQALLYILKPDGNLELRPVKVGRAVGLGFVIDEGLKAGEQVVVKGFQKIRPGTRFTGAPWEQVSNDPAAASADAGKRG